MTSALRTNAKSSLKPGINLLEIVIAILIIGMITTMGVVVYNGQADDKALRRAAVEIEALSSTAHTRAFLQQEPHRLHFTQSQGIKIETPQQENEFGEVTYTAIKSYTPDLQISIRRWGDRENHWQKPKTKGLHWYFSGNGLCEPLSIKIEEGSNWIILHMDALTGRVKEEESYIAR